MTNRAPNSNKLTRRDFARRAALLSATATLVPAQAILPPATQAATAPPDQVPDNLPRLSAAGQAEADLRYQQVLTRYGSRLSDAEKSTVKTLCIFLQPSVEHVRAYPLDNSDAPGLYLKPLVEREKKPTVNPAPAARAAAPKKS